jgi:competence protein ComEA
MNMLKSLALSCALVFAGFASAGTPVNVNSADAAAIAQGLDGVGMAKAEAIVAYRTEHGPFKALEDLAKVKGIGMATIEKNREFIQLGAEGKAASKPTASR